MGTLSDLDKVDHVSKRPSKDIRPESKEGNRKSSYGTLQGTNLSKIY